MPKTCRTDTFMSGNPTGSSLLVMAAVVINPRRPRTFSETELLNWLRMGAGTSLAESKGRQKPAAQSKYRCVFIRIDTGHGFSKAALRITPHFCHNASF